MARLKTRILLISKVPTLRQLDAEDLERVDASQVLNRDALRASERDHLTSLDLVRRSLPDAYICERRIDELQADDTTDIDLAVSVGGDGTVLAAASMLRNTPLLAVNSDPQRSIGHFTRCNAEGCAKLFNAWRGQPDQVELIPRLSLSIAGDPTAHHILNDCLFTNQNPAAMTRYRIDWQGHSEDHHSSGVWIATAAGSTAAIHSAGMASLDAHQEALLFRVREPFQGRQQLALLQDVVSPPSPLHLTAAIPGIRCYIDGSHRFLAIPVATTICVQASQYPLRLVGSVC